MLTELIEYFKNTPEDQIKRDWDKTKIWDKVGPTVDEFLKSINSEPQIEARSVKENEQTKEVCPNCKRNYTHFDLYENKCLGCGNVIRTN